MESQKKIMTVLVCRPLSCIAASHPSDVYIALKHYTSKLSSFTDLSTVRTFGFRGEALSSLCALCEKVVVTTTTSPPMGVALELEPSGKVRKRSNIARQVSVHPCPHRAVLNFTYSVEPRSLSHTCLRRSLFDGRN